MCGCKRIFRRTKVNSRYHVYVGVSSHNPKAVEVIVRKLVYSDEVNHKDKNIEILKIFKNLYLIEFYFAISLTTLSVINKYVWKYMDGDLRTVLSK